MSERGLLLCSQLLLILRGQLLLLQLRLLHHNLPLPLLVLLRRLLVVLHVLCALPLVAAAPSVLALLPAASLLLALLPLLAAAAALVPLLAASLATVVLGRAAPVLLRCARLLGGRRPLRVRHVA